MGDPAYLVPEGMEVFGIACRDQVVARRLIYLPAFHAGTQALRSGLDRPDHRCHRLLYILRKSGLAWMGHIPAALDVGAVVLDGHAQINMEDMAGFEQDGGGGDSMAYHRVGAAVD